MELENRGRKPSKPAPATWSTFSCHPAVHSALYVIGWVEGAHGGWCWPIHGTGCQSLPSPRTGLAAGAAHTHRGAYLTSTKLRALYHLSHNLGRKMRLRELKKQSEATQN